MRMSIEELPAIVELAAELGATTVYANNTIIYEPAMAQEALVHHPALTTRMVQQAMARAVALGVKFVNNLVEVTDGAKRSFILRQAIRTSLQQ
jgi:hypothetical protein